MPYTPQLHVYDRMPEMPRLVEADEKSAMSLTNNFRREPKAVRTGKFSWRQAFSFFPQSLSAPRTASASRVSTTVVRRSQAVQNIERLTT